MAECVSQTESEENICVFVCVCVFESVFVYESVCVCVFVPLTRVCHLSLRKWWHLVFPFHGDL